MERKYCCFSLWCVYIYIIRRKVGGLCFAFFFLRKLDPFKHLNKGKGYMSKRT